MRGPSIQNEDLHGPQKRKRILVTGSHRSGTTWVGQMIARAPGTGYVHEPFKVEGGLGGFANPFTTWFQYVTDENAGQYEPYLDSLIRFKYPLATHLVHSKSAKEVARNLRDAARFSNHRLRGDTAIVKDPIALFSAPWMARHFDLNVVVMIRHPAAFVSSLKIKNWQFDFTNFLSQPRLLRETRLGTFEQEIRCYAEHRPEILQQAILLWNCIYIVVDEYRTSHPEWLFLKHEELSLDPVRNFRSVYAELGLQFTSKASAAIEETSGAQNPSEQVERDVIRRNSRANVFNWKTRLTEREIMMIKEGTHEVSKLFYSGADW